MNSKSTVGRLAALVDGEVIGDAQQPINGFGPLDAARPGELSFLAKAAGRPLLEASAASAFIVPAGFTAAGKTLIRVGDPYLAAALIQNALLHQPFVAAGIHQRAVVGSDCRLSPEISIGALAVIGDRVSIGERVTIGAGVVIGDDVTIGDDCTIRPQVTIEPRCEIGNRVTIHPGTVIGSDGYGYATDRRGCHVKRPQLGIVRIGDDVEIGANTCIDRATFGVTWIKSGTKIDNLVQIAHNVVVGENSLLVSQVGLAGSTTLGRNVVFGGQAGAAGHQSIGDRTMVAGTAAVHGDHPADSQLAGVPAIPAKQWFKAASLFGKLPEIVRDIRQLKKELAQLKETE
ncbi:MAG: UDP-3-O-(3-hydroxymyristoyl)glucosamine N-acyltransferase [Desulfofustis sp.]|nr:UDP-3-O-(3-hydroxymyristoyl)glucosamine N-acyltransferase [Desulfofustis sp.]